MAFKQLNTIKVGRYKSLITCFRRLEDYCKNKRS